MMSREELPADPAQQWDVLLCIIAFEERKLHNSPMGAMETLDYVFNHAGIQQIFTEWMRQMKRRYDRQTKDDSSRKSDELSVLWRERGNEKYRDQQYDESYILFTKSVLYAQKESPLFAVAVANRSAASLKLKHYEECLNDVRRALNHAYPPDLKHKLYLRRAECHYQLGEVGGCVAALRAAEAHAEIVKLGGISKSQLENSCRSMEEKLSAIKYETLPCQLHLPNVYAGKNPEFRSASNAVELVRNSEVGRHVLVKKPVKRGDVIFSEDPFAAVPLSTNQLPHPFYCDFCCGGERAMIGCEKCSRVAYCDGGCQGQGCNIYHRWECAGVRANIFQNIGIAHLAFRVMLKYAFKDFPLLPNGGVAPTTAAEVIEAYTDVDDVSVYNSGYSEFFTMFKLATNFDVPSNADYIQYSVTSTMLTLYLEQYTKFFDYFADRVGYPLPLHELKLLCATLIYRSLGQLLTNAHTVMELNCGAAKSIPSCFLSSCIRNPWRRVGSAVYPTASMMNHSCEPNITNVFYRNRLLVKAIREVPVGDEIVNCYGPHSARHNTDVRRDRLLNQYGFYCKCPACVDETRKDFVSMFSAYACQSCKGPVTWVGARMSCHQCYNDFPLQQAQNAAETAEALHAIAMQANTKEERLSHMLRSYKLMQQVLYRHHNILRKAADDLAMLYHSVGDYTKSIDLVKQNVQSNEYQYGSFSVEVTNEVRKMANLMISRVMKHATCSEIDSGQQMPMRDWIRETLNIVRKANQLMELNFGSWQWMYRTLKDNEEVLEGMLTETVEQEIGCFNFRLRNLSLL